MSNSLGFNNMMIVGKYVNTVNDLINIMKINKKYKILCDEYHFNPVKIYNKTELKLFPKLHTYHFYTIFDYYPEDPNLDYVYEFEIVINYHPLKTNEKYLKSCEYIDINNLKNKYNSTTLRRHNINDTRAFISNIELGKKVKYIEYGAFSGICAKTITLSDSIEQLGTFQNNTLLTEIVIPDLITEIPSYCFYGCCELQKVTLGKNVKKINNFSFAGCEKLKNIDLTNVNELNICSFINCCSLTDVILSTNITIIPSCCFAGCSHLENINLEYVKIIDESGLRHTNIKYIYLINIEKIDKLGVAMNKFIEVYLGSKLNICESSIHTKFLVCPEKFKNKINVINAEIQYY